MPSGPGADQRFALEILRLISSTVKGCCHCSGAGADLGLEMVAGRRSGWLLGARMNLSARTTSLSSQGCDADAGGVSKGGDLAELVAAVAELGKLPQRLRVGGLDESFAE